MAQDTHPRWLKPSYSLASDRVAVQPLVALQAAEAGWSQPWPQWWGSQASGRREQGSGPHI